MYKETMTGQSRPNGAKSTLPPLCASSVENHVLFAAAMRSSTELTALPSMVFGTWVAASLVAERYSKITGGIKDPWVTSRVPHKLVTPSRLGSALSRLAAKAAASATTALQLDTTVRSVVSVVRAAVFACRVRTMDTKVDYRGPRTDNHASERQMG